MAPDALVVPRRCADRARQDDVDGVGVGVRHRQIVAAVLVEVARGDVERPASQRNRPRQREAAGAPEVQQNGNRRRLRVRQRKISPPVGVEIDGDDPTSADRGRIVIPVEEEDSSICPELPDGEQAGDKDWKTAAYAGRHQHLAGHGGA